MGSEAEKLLAATKGSRHKARDRCLLLLMFRHGLRVSEACALKLDQVDIERRVLNVDRLKKGLSTTHRRARVITYQGIAGRAGQDEADRQGIFCKPAPEAS